MSNAEIYDNTFMDVFMIGKDVLDAGFEMKDNELWDSVGHISLITALEDAFNIAIDMDDMAQFISYEAGKAILQKYNITV